MNKVFFFILCGISVIKLYAQTYQHQYGGSENDVFYSTTASFRTGKVISAGYTQGFGASGKDIIVTESDINGISWSFRIGDALNQEAYWVERNPSDKTYLLMGYTTTAATGKDLFVCKLDTMGNILWQKTIASAGDEEIKDGNEYIFNLGTGTDTFYVFVGHFDGVLSYGQHDIFYLVLDKNGNEVMMKKIGTTANEINPSISTYGTLGANRFVIGCSSDMGGNYDVWSLEMDSSGAIIKAHNFDGGSDDYNTDVSPFVTGWGLNLNQAQSIVGNTTSFGPGDEDAFFIYFDGNTNTLSKTYGYDGKKENMWRIEDFGGMGLLVAGSYENDEGNMDALIVFFDRTGNLETGRGFSMCPSDEVFYDLAGIPGSNPWESYPVAAGKTNNLIFGNEDGLSARYDSPWNINSGCKDVFYSWENVTDVTFTYSNITASVNISSLSGNFSYAVGTLVKTPIAVEDSNLCQTGSLNGFSTNWEVDTITICSNQTYDLVVFSECPDSIRWFYGGNVIARNIDTLTAINGGLYQVYGNKGYGGYKKSIYINIIQSMTPVINEQNLCLGDTTKFSVFGISGSYNWIFDDPASGGLNSANGMNVKHFYADTGTYLIKLISPYSCSTNDTVYETIKISTKPTFVLRDTNLCFGDTVILRATTSNATYLWENNSTDSVRKIIYSNSYHVTVNVNGCIKRDTANLDFYVKPTPSLSPKYVGCSGDSVMLNAFYDFFWNYQWSTGSTQPRIYAKTSGIYKVKTYLGNCFAWDSTEVEFKSAPNVNLGNDTTLCQGDSIILRAKNPGSTYLWNNATLDSLLTVKNSGLYWVEASITSCKNRDSIQVTFNNKPQAGIPTSSVGCNGTALNLNAGNLTLPFASFLWNNGSTDRSINVSNDSLFIVRIVNGACTVYDSTNVSFLPAPTVNLGNDTILCQGDSIILRAKNSGSAYLWNNATTDSLLKVTNSGLYWVEASISTCKNRDSIQVNFNTKPQAVLPSDTAGCSGTPLNMNAGNLTLPLASFSWNNGSNSRSINVSNDSLYIVRIINGACTIYDSTNVSFLPAPTVNLGNDTTICQGNALLLDATNLGSTYLWNNGTNANTLSVSSTNTYSITVNLSGCIDRDTITVTVADKPQALLPDTTFGCIGESLTLNAGNINTTYLWSIGGNNSTLQVNSGGPYSVILTKGNCINYDTTIAVFRPKPIVNLGKDTSLCEGISLILDAQNSGANYTWNGASGAQQLNVTTSGSYIGVVSLNQCSASDTVNVNFISYPTQVLPKELSLCLGDSIVLDVSGSGGNSYNWSNGSTQNKITIDENGLYKVLITNQICTISDSSLVNFVLPPSVYFSDTTLCEGQTLLLDANNPNYTYKWYLKSDTSNVLSENNNFAVSEPGIYAVKLTQSLCIKEFDATISFNPQPKLNLVEKVYFCADDKEELYLTSEKTNLRHTWSNGDTTNSIKITDVGVYTLVVSDSIGCSASDETEVISFCETKIYIPNAFTPNGDGLNDRLEIFGENIQNFNIRVLNQWGEIVFQSNDINVLWDGSFNGKIISGTYAAIIQYSGDFKDESSQKSFSMDITILK